MSAEFGTEDSEHSLGLGLALELLALESDASDLSNTVLGVREGFEFEETGNWLRGLILAVRGNLRLVIPGLVLKL